MIRFDSSSMAKVQGSVSDYHKYVIDGLVRIDGHGGSQVVAHMIRDWIREHGAYLEKLGLSVDDWRKSVRSQVEAVSPKVVSLEEKQDAKLKAKE